MCGIAGLFQARQRSMSREEAMHLVDRMNDTIAHRGPDAEGVWSDSQGRCTLGQRRLSIIDTSDAGRQPFSSGDGRWWITFNGEIYNFQDVRAELEREGVRFRGRTDTEVLVEAVAFWGVDALPRLDGMFAFAAYDTQTRSLFLARDPFGEKPLYYTSLPSGGVAFASELQALEQIPGFNAGVSLDAIAEVLSFQYIGAPRSIYTGTKKLQPGHWMRIDDSGETRIERYFQFRPGSSGFTHRPMAELADELEDILTRSLKRRLFADVPLGAFLSGGVDSSTVCALVRRKLNLPLHTFSMGFEGSSDSEHDIARAFAEHLGTEHREQLVDPHGSDFLRNIGAVLDEPNADSSCLPTYLLSGFARQFVTVALSGDGGDELFGGYGRYFATLEESGRQAAGELPNWQPGETYYGNRILVSTEPHIEELFGFVPPGFAAHVNEARKQLDAAPRARLLSRMRQSDAANYMPGAVLPKVDRMSMQHALEVRTPFLNVELARFAERLPDEVLVGNGRGKLVLRELAYRYLPRELIDMPKKGFGLPMSDWARTSLLNLASELLGSEETRVLPLFGRQGIARFLERQHSQGGFSTYQVWALVMLESWLRHHPAKVPDLSERRPRQVPPPKLGALNLAEVSGQIWLVSRGDPDVAFDPDRDSKWHRAPPAMVNRVIELVGEGQGTAAKARKARLPDWGIAVSPADIDRLHVLKDATLVFLDLDAESHLDHGELFKLSLIGVRRVVCISRYIANSIRELNINQKSFAQRLLHAGLLALQSSAFIANRRAFRLPFRASTFQVSHDARCVTDELPGVERAQDADLFDKYMVFEGLRQLPPVQNSHEDIRSKGGGRYSIWNQRLFFSPTSVSRLYTHPFWIVKKTARNESLLQFAPAVRQVQPRTSGQLDVESLYAADRAHESVKLHAGDVVVVCTHGLPPGGAERQWVYLAIGLKRAGYDVNFLMYDEPVGHNAHYLPLLQAAGIPIHSVTQQPPSSLLRMIANDRALWKLSRAEIVEDTDRLSRLVAAFRQLKPKAVFAQLDEPNIYAGLASLLAGVPRVVVSFRNYNPTHFPYLFKDWYQSAYKLLGRSERVLFSGNFDGANRDYEKWIGLEAGRAVCIPNAVSLENFPVPSRGEVEDVREGLNLKRGQKVILGVFRLSAEKNPQAFVEVCARIAAHHPDVRAFIVGVGPLMPSLEEEVAERGLSQTISFLGRRSDVNVLMSIADLLLLTSDREGMPNVVLEAQLIGLPVVATDAGGTRNAMLPDVTGRLCPVGDVEALHRACTELLDNEDLARRMGEAGARHAREDFSIATMAQRYAALVGADESGRAPERVLEKDAVL